MKYTATVTLLCAAVLGLMPAQRAAAQTDGEPSKKNTMVFQFGGPGGSEIDYRIPAIATVEAGKNKGRLVAINDLRHCGSDIGGGRVDLVQSVSDDNGKTWSKPAPLLAADGSHIAEGDGSRSAVCGFGDAALVSDRKTGELLLISVGGYKLFFRARHDDPQRVFRWYSKDGGQTWENREEFTDQIMNLFEGEPQFGKIDAFFFGSGRIMQSRKVANGTHYRLYAAISSQNDGGNTRNWVLYSDDFGKNWQILGGVPAVAVDGDEPKVEELPDGSVLLSARGYRGGRNFNIFRYDDTKTAKGQWAGVINTDMGQGYINACNGEIMILPVTDKQTGEKMHLAVQTFPYGGKRSHVSIIWKALRGPADYSSPESFRNWDGRMLLTELPSAYSTMTLQKDNSLGILIEEATHGKSYSSVYRNLTIPELTDGRYEVR